MKSVISGPGFYLSKAGKCEVVAVRETSGGPMAVGYCPHGDALIWEGETGHAKGVAFDLCDCHITGPWVEPRKPVEAWAVVCKLGNVRELSVKREISEEYRLAHWGHGARLVHLREVEDAASLAPKATGEGLTLKAIDKARLSELAWVVSQCERDAVEFDCPDFVRRVKARMKQLETGKE